MDPSYERPKTAIGVIHGGWDRLNLECPGLPDAMEAADRDEISIEDYTRRLLNSIKDIPEFLDGLSQLNEDLQKMLLDFMHGKTAKEVTRGGFKLPLSLVTEQHFKEMKIAELSSEGEEEVHLLDDGGKPMKVKSLSIFH